MRDAMEQSVYKELEDCDNADISDDSNHSFHLPVTENPPSLTGGYLSPKALTEWRWANVDNLDLFLRQVYEYYVDKGFFCIILSRIVKMATVLFVVIFSNYLYSCIDYKRLKLASSLGDIRVQRCLANTSWIHYFGLWIFGILWILKAFQYVSDARTLWEIHEFYYYMLDISEDEIQTISWQHVVNRMVKLRSINGASHQRLNAHSIVNRIMRQENYMIALYNRHVLDLEVDLPLGGRYEFLTKLLEWNISMCLDDFLFNDRGHLRSLVMRQDKRDLLVQSLKRRFQFIAIVNVLLIPFAMFYMSLYYFFRYFNDYYSKPKDLGVRQYTPLAEWKFRELNELFHLFRRRLSMSDQPAQRYISLFPRIKTELIIKFVIFVSSSIAAVLLMLTVYDPELVNMEIYPGQNVLFYIGATGFIIAISRAMLSTPQEQAIYQPEAAMRQIVEFTHYMPEEWENKLHTEPVKDEFTKLYDLKPKIILRDLLSVVLNPVILGIKIANRSDRIVDFFREYSIQVEDLGGYVCSLAVFNTDRITKIKARSDELDRFYATKDGKMLKSYLNFMDVYGPQETRNLASLYQSSYEPGSSSLTESTTHNTDLRELTKAANVPSSSNNAEPFVSRRTNLEGSVMGQYDKLKALSPVVEESRSQNTLETNFFSENEEDEEEEDSIADEGVLGLLNNLYKK